MKSNPYVELARRLDEIGLSRRQIDAIPRCLLLRIVQGRNLLLVIREDHCPKCGGDHVLITAGPKTDLSLEKLFHP